MENNYNDSACLKTPSKLEELDKRFSDAISNYENLTVDLRIGLQKILNYEEPVDIRPENDKVIKNTALEAVDAKISILYKLNSRLESSLM